MILFILKNPIVTFRYSNNSFNFVFKNNKNMGEVEKLIKQRQELVMMLVFTVSKTGKI
jgi:hypothetical protein